MTTLTPRRQIVLKLFEHAANNALPAPTDRDIANELGIQSGGSANKYVRELVAMGLISIENVLQNRRVVTIVGTGRSTVMPRPKRENAGRRKQIVSEDKPESRVTTSEERMAMVRGGPPLVKDRIKIEVFSPALTCQYPFDETPDITFCGKPTISESSYCARHHARCYRPSDFYTKRYEGRA